MRWERKQARNECMVVGQPQRLRHRQRKERLQDQQTSIDHERLLLPALKQKYPVRFDLCFLFTEPSLDVAVVSTIVERDSKPPSCTRFHFTAAQRLTVPHLTEGHRHTNKQRENQRGSCSINRLSLG
eukprot:scaffold1771_cov172-Amphora_coffeaeformis.AAC.7